MGKILTFILFILWFMSLPAYGVGPYYVDNDRPDNSGVGTSWATAWKELPQTTGAAAGNWNGVTIQAGDTIYLDAGDVWTKEIVMTTARYNGNASGDPIIITSSSTSTRAIFDYTAGGNLAIDVVGIDNLTFQYLEIRNLTAAGTTIGIRLGQSGSDTSQNCKILYCYIHDVTDSNTLPTENNSYAISLLNRSGTEIAYNILKNVDKKHISSNELYAGGDNIHHNVVYNEADYTGDPQDHMIVVSSTAGGNLIHDNIVWNLHKYYGQCYAINIVQGGNNNKIYNNIIRGHTIGIVIRSSGTYGNNNEIVHNTVYLANCPMTYEEWGNTVQHSGIRLEEGSGHIVKNNLIYYPHLNASNQAIGIVQEANATSAHIHNNLIYYDATNKERCTVTGTGGGTITISALNDSWSGDASNNAVTNPAFSGGAYPVTSLPDGFDTNWHPNNTGLQLTSNMMSGDATVGATYATDIQGNTRTNYNPGAYEYGSDTTPPTVMFSTLQTYYNNRTVHLNSQYSFSATDGGGGSVAGYKLTESATPPGAGDEGWTASPPTTYTFGSDGAKTLYAWAKDNASPSNVSQTPVDADITIDIANPTCTISTNGGSNFTTRATTLTLTGTSSDATAGVASVSSNKGGTPSGTTTWTISNIPLAVGANAITVTAVDNATNQGTAAITVTSEPGQGFRCPVSFTSGGTFK